MSTAAFFLSYLVSFVISLSPMLFFGEPTLSLLFFLMMNAGYAASLGLYSLGWGFALTFLVTAYTSSEPLLGLLFAIATALPVLVGIVLQRGKYSFGERYVGTAAALFIPYSVWEMANVRAAGYTMKGLFRESAEQVMETAVSLELLPEAELPALSEMLSAAIPYMVGLVPGCYLIFSLLGAYLTLSGLSRGRAGKRTVPSFGEIKAPRLFALCAIVLIPLCAFVPDETVRIYLLNGALIAGFFALAGGISLVDHYLSKAVQSGTLRFFIYLLAVNLTSMTILVPALFAGILDAFLDFRKLNVRKRKGEEQ